MAKMRYFSGRMWYLKSVAKLYRLDQRLAKIVPPRMKKIHAAMSRLDRLRRAVFMGASKGFKLERTGNRTRDAINFFVFKLFALLDRLDTRLFYKTKSKQAKFGRVCSDGEKAIANFLWTRGISFIYEQPVGVGGHLYVPDFFLPAEGVFVEYFGLMNVEEYRRRHDSKLADYNLHKVPVIAIYPSHLGRLEAELFRQLESLRQRKLTI